MVLCAPTGRAAKRMTETTGHEAKTIHRLLEYGGEEGQFGRNQDTPIEGDCIIADENVHGGYDAHALLPARGCAGVHA